MQKSIKITSTVSIINEMTIFDIEIRIYESFFNSFFVIYHSKLIFLTSHNFEYMSRIKELFSRFILLVQTFKITLIINHHALHQIINYRCKSIVHR